MGWGVGKLQILLKTTAPSLGRKNNHFQTAGHSQNLEHILHSHVTEMVRPLKTLFDNAL